MASCVILLYRSRVFCIQITLATVTNFFTYYTSQLVFVFFILYIDYIYIW